MLYSSLAYAGSLALFGAAPVVIGILLYLISQRRGSGG
jgi:hypothetical protein